MKARILGAMGLALLLTTPVGAASAASDREAFLGAWTDVLLAKDPDRIAAMPSAWPGVDASEGPALAAAVLDRVLARDAEAAAHFAGLAPDVLAERRAEAEALVARLMFDREALVAELAAGIPQPDLEAPAAAPAPPAEVAVLDAARAAVEARAVLPAALRPHVLGAVPPVPLPEATLAADLPALPVGQVPALASFAVCYRTATAEGCTPALPMLVPAAVDVTGDKVPDLLATLAPSVEPTTAPPGLQPQGLLLRLDRLPPVRLAPLPALVVGVMAFGDQRAVVGYDAFSPQLPADARDAPISFQALANLGAGPQGQQAAMLLRVEGAPAAMRVLGGMAPGAGVPDPDKVVLADLRPVPSTVNLALSTEQVGSVHKFAFSFEASAPTDLVAQAVERDAAAKLVRVERLTAGGIDVAFTLKVERDAATGAEAWDWNATAPLAKLEYALDSTRYLDAALAQRAAWREHALLLEDLPAKLRLELPLLGHLTVRVEALVGSIGHRLRTYDFQHFRETWDSVVARGVSTDLELGADGIAAVFGSTAGARVTRVEMQTASLDKAPVPGAIGRLLFDLTQGATNFVGIRGDTAAGGRALALRFLDLPTSLEVRLGLPGNGVALRVLASARLPFAEGIVDIDHHLATLQLSSLPRDTTLDGRFAPGFVEFGYTADEGIARAFVTYIDERRTRDPSGVHAYAEMLQLPSAMKLTLTRQLDAPALRYTASASTLDVRALVSEALTGGDLRTRVLASIDNLGKDTAMGLVDRAGKRVLRLDSAPSTDRFFAEGLVSVPAKGDLDKRIDGGWYEILYGYHIDVTATIKNFRTRIDALKWLEVELEQPNVLVKGVLGALALAWDTLELRGPSSAWLKVYVTILWFRFTVWDWGWNVRDLFNLNLDITPFHAHWAELYGIDLLWCRFSIEAIPHAHTTVRNALGVGALNGETWYFFLNPLDAAGKALVPGFLAHGYMIWKYGDWRLALRC